MTDVPFHQTRMGRRFYEVTLRGSSSSSNG